MSQCRVSMPAGSAGREWIEDGRPGVSYAVLRVADDSAGATVLTRFAKGVSTGPHSHPGGEELYVISGSCTVDGHHLTAGDYLYTPPGEETHELVAHEDTEVLVVLPRFPIYAAEAPVPNAS